MRIGAADVFFNLVTQVPHDDRRTRNASCNEAVEDMAEDRFASHRQKDLRLGKSVGAHARPKTGDWNDRMHM